MNNVNNAVKYIELIGDRPYVELEFRSQILSNQAISENGITKNLFHPALWQQIYKILEAESVAKVNQGYLEINFTNAETFYYCVDLIKVGKEHTWNSKHQRPIVFASPPQLIPKQIAADVDDISSLLIELVGGVKHDLTLLSPYTTASALVAILSPLLKMPRANDVSIKLFIANPLREAQRQIDRLETLLPENIFRSISFYYRSDLSQEEENILHAKVLLVDKRRGYLGSANFTDQGLAKHFELGIELNDKQVSLVEELLEELIKKKVFLPA